MEVFASASQFFALYSVLMLGHRPLHALVYWGGGGRNGTQWEIILILFRFFFLVFLSVNIHENFLHFSNMGDF